MAVLLKKLTGLKTIADSDGTSIDIPLPSAVALAHSAVSVTAYSLDNEDRIKRYVFTPSLSDANTLTLTRHDAGFAKSVYVEWVVYEWDSSVTVHSGESAILATSTDLSIGATINVASSFPILNMRTNANALETNNTFRGSLSTTELTIDVNAAPSASRLTVGWQIVEFAPGDAAVQSGTITLGTGDASQPSTLSPAVDPAKTFIVPGGMSTNNGFGGVHRNAATLALTDSVTVTAEKTLRGSHTDVVQFYAVEMLDGTTVVSGNSIIDAGDTTPTTPPSFAAMTTPTVAPACYLQNERNTDTAADRKYGANRAGQVVTGTNDGIDITRGLTTGPLKVEWTAIDWNVSAGSDDRTAAGTVTLPSLVLSAAGNISAPDRTAAGTVTLPSLVFFADSRRNADYTVVTTPLSFTVVTTKNEYVIKRNGVCHL